MMRITGGQLRRIVREEAARLAEDAPSLPRAVADEILDDPGLVDDVDALCSRVAGEMVKLAVTEDEASYEWERLLKDDILKAIRAVVHDAETGA